MSTFLPPDVQAGLDSARKKSLKDKHRLRIQAGENMYRVIHAWENGFSLDRDIGQTIRGRVDLYDGARHLSQCCKPDNPHHGKDRDCNQHLEQRKTLLVIVYLHNFAMKPVALAFRSFSPSM